MRPRSDCSPSCTGACRCAATAAPERGARSEFDAAHDRLRSKGLVDDSGFTEAGRTAREQVEVHTDQQMAATVAALGDDIEELFTIMQPWGDAIREGLGYLPSGPHDLARAAAGG